MVGSSSAHTAMRGPDGSIKTHAGASAYLPKFLPAMMVCGADQPLASLEAKRNAKPFPVGSSQLSMICPSGPWVILGAMLPGAAGFANRSTESSFERLHETAETSSITASQTSVRYLVIILTSVRFQWFLSARQLQPHSKESLERRAELLRFKSRIRSHVSTV